MSIPRIDRGAGMVGTTIQFQNMSPSTCSLSGYPMVMLVDGAGHTLLSATEETSSATLAPAILLPTQKATARLDSDAVQTNFSVPCVSTTTLSVTPPGSTRPLSVDDDHAQGLAGSIDACDGATIEPVQAQSIPGKRTPLPCPGGTLYVIPGRVISDAKYKGIVVMLQNDSGWNCTITGYPAVAVAVDLYGTPVLIAKPTLRGYLGGAAEGISAPPTVTVHAGKRASFLVEGTNPAQGRRCIRYSSFGVVPPNSTGVPNNGSDAIRGGICAPIDVHPVVPGTSGTQ